MPLLVSVAVIAVACGGEATSVVLDDAASDVLDAAIIDAARSRDAAPDARFDAGTCGPPDISTFVPAAYVPATGARQGVCTPAQVDDFYAKCLDNGTMASCALYIGPAATPENKACAACIVTKDTASKYGPLVQSKGYISVNIAGCMELFGGVAGAQCGHAYQVSNACNAFVCANPCPVDWCDFGCYDRCVQAAAANDCKSYAVAAACAEAEADGGPAALCFRGRSFQELYSNVVALFCGASATDAAAD